MTGAYARLRAALTPERQILALIVVAGVGLASAHLAHASLSGYYATAVRSMSQSWHAWFFGALDPAATISVDKVPGWLQIQALFVRILGFHGWVVELPQILAEGVSVVALYVGVRRWRGVGAARIAAILFILVPIVTPTFAHSMEDGPLACCLILALDRAHRAAVTGRVRPLVAAGLWIGLGFQMKMLVAWVVLPAVVLAYLLCAPVSRRARWFGAAIGTVVTVASSLVWVICVALIPAGSRPWIDGTADNNVFTMVFGYNALERFGVHLSGAMPQLLRLSNPPFVPGDGWTKLVAGHLLPQVGWVLPLALAGLVMGWRTHREARAGYLIWGGAGVLFFAVLSAADRLPHAAYVVVLAAPLAALAAGFLADLPQMSRRVVAGAVIVQAAWTAWVWAVEPGFAPWARWGSVALAVVVLVNLRRPVAPRVMAGAAAAVMLVGPLTWTLSTLDPAYAGSDIEATAGPPGPLLASVATPAQLAAFGAEGADFVQPSPSLTGDAAEVWRVAKERQGTAAYPLTTVGWYIAQPFILATGESVWPIGGYSHLIPTPTLADYQARIASGQVRMVLLGAYALKAAIQDGSTSNQIVQWTAAHCAVVKTWVYPRSGPIVAGLELLDCGQLH